MSEPKMRAEERMRRLSFWCLASDVLEMGLPEKVVRLDFAEALVAEVTRERDEARAEVERLLRSRDEAYTERNALVAALSKVFPASLEQHDEADASWDPEWRTIIAIELPTGQATWHIHDRERGMFAHLRHRVGYAWDGHTTAEKYARIAALAPEAEVEP